jgi:hypothetical protein
MAINNVNFFPDYYPKVIAELSEDPFTAASDLLVLLVPEELISNKDGDKGENVKKDIR